MKNAAARAVCSIAVLSICFFCSASLIAAQVGALARDKEKDTCGPYLGAAVPKYRIARQFRDRTEYGSSLTILLSVDQKDVTRDNLLALSCKLGADHSNEDGFFVFILDTRRAAKRFVPLGDPGNDRQTNKAYRAFYAFSREDPQLKWPTPYDVYALTNPRGPSGQSLSWKPDPSQPDRWVSIDLGPPPPAH